MKKTLAFLLGVTTGSMLVAQGYSKEYKVYIKKADSLYTAKDYKNSANNYSLAFKSFAWKGAVNDRYNAARSWAMANEKDSAFFCLDRIVNKTGFSDYEKVTTEEAFNVLHSDKRWEQLLNDISKNKLPSGWFRAGNKPTCYQMRIDSGVGQDGGKVLTIKSIENNIKGFGTLMQHFLPDKYLGKRIKMTGYMKSQEVSGWAGFWLRVDKENSKRSLSFDNMYDRGVKGNTEWKKYEIVLDVPKNASNIAFGALLDGTGQIWFEKFSFEVVDTTVPITGKVKNEPNLDFDK